MSQHSIPFHLALPVDDLEAAREFYLGLMGLRSGREDARWIDLDFFGHQVTLHLCETSQYTPTNAVDGDNVPVRHFGAILPPAQWQVLARRFQEAGVTFVIEPRTRFAGEPGEQSTMFLLDPAGNALEFKSFADNAKIFARG